MIFLHLWWYKQQVLLAQFSSHTDDSILWQHFRVGNEAAYTELTRRYYRKLIHYGRKFTPNVQLVEDSLQDVLVHLWLHRRTLNDTPSVKFYLLKSFRNQLFKTLKTNLDRIELDSRFDELQPEFSSEEVYIQQETDQSFRTKVGELLAQLPERQREVIYLRFFQGLRPEEIAELLTIKPQSVSNILQRALANLRENWPISLFIALLLLF
ncbi:RNA polymerase sigma factor [Larkinella terrae]|nr:sigma-70 family RNA polymerase sigma factor [Larkinella terrae]